MNAGRKSKFEKWWGQNSHRTTGHTWLTKHARRVLHNYNAPPEQYSHTLTIIKRYNLSVYKRLSKTDAYFLWRLIHPSMSVRATILKSTADFLQTKVDATNRKFSK